MIAWAVTFLALSAVGATLTAVLLRESTRDRRASTLGTRDLADQIVRHEAFRLVKHVLIVAAIGIGLAHYLGYLSRDFSLLARDGIFGTLSLLLTYNSLMDLRYRVRTFRRKMIAWERSGRSSERPSR